MRKLVFLFFIVITIFCLNGCCCPCGKNVNWNSFISTPTATIGKPTVNVSLETPTVNVSYETPNKESTPSSTETTSSKLEFVDFTFLESKKGPATEKSSITKDETLYFKFTVKGYTNGSDDKAWITEDFMIENTDGTEICRKDNILNYHDTAPNGVVITNNYTPAVTNTPPGKYVAHVKVKDKNSTATGEEHFNFEITE